MVAQGKKKYMYSVQVIHYKSYMYRDQLSWLTSRITHWCTHALTHTNTTLLFLNVSVGCNLLSDKADQRNANCIFSAARSGLVCWTSVSDDQLHPRGCTVIHICL